MAWRTLGADFIYLHRSFSVTYAGRTFVVLPSCSMTVDERPDNAGARPNGSDHRLAITHVLYSRDCNVASTVRAGM